jgi:hypothetical protein
MQNHILSEKEEVRDLKLELFVEILLPHVKENPTEKLCLTPISRKIPCLAVRVLWLLTEPLHIEGRILVPLLAGKVQRIQLIIRAVFKYEEILITW